MPTTKVISTGTNDHVAIQAAHDAASDDDIIEIEQADAATKFDFGASGQVVVSKQLTFVGVGDEKPTIVGGANCWEVSAGGKNVAIRNIKAENCNERFLDTLLVNNITVEDVDVEMDTVQGHTFVSPTTGEDTFEALVIAGNLSTVVGGEITGKATCRRCTIEFEKTADPTDPYAGARSVLDPRSVSDGGPWVPGATTPGTWGSMGIAAWLPPPGGLEVVDCVVRNYSRFAVTYTDALGKVEIDGNTAQTPYGAHGNASANGSIGILALNAFGRLIELPEVQQQHGEWDIKRNVIAISGKTLVGIFAGTFTGGPFKPAFASFRENNVSSEELANYGILAFGVDHCYVGQNRVSGQGTYGIRCGWLAPVRLWGTDRIQVVGNDLNSFQATTAAYGMTADTVEGVVSDVGDNSVQDSGTNNQILR